MASEISPFEYTNTKASRMVIGKKRGFGGLEVSVLTFGTQVRGFKTGRRRRIFFGRKNPQRAFLRRGSKAFGPMS